MTLAISILQPWAWLIVHGWKDIENRTWRHSHRGRTIVHTGKKIDGEAHQAVLRGEHPVTGLALPEELRLAYTAALMDGKLHRGGIVGEVNITGCVDHSDSEWFVGPHGFTLSDAKPLPFFAMNGRLGYFPVETDPVQPT
jgi:hypothetical protein